MITVGSGEQLIVPKIGHKVEYITRINGKEQKIILMNTKYVPDICVNLITLTTVMNEGFESIGSKGQMSIRKDGNEYRFDSQIKSGEGILHGIEIQNQPTVSSRTLITKINYNDMHDKLGHAGEALTRNIAK